MKQHLLTAAIAATALSTLPISAISHEQGDLIVRTGAATVAPNDDSGLISVAGLGGPVAGTGVGLESDTQMGLTIAYMLTNNWGVELLASTPFEHKITAQGLGGFGVSEIGSVEHLPPTLSLQYYFDTGNQNLNPYAGVGLNYILVLDESLSNEIKTSAIGATSMDLDDSFGVSLQAGLDYSISNNWMINASVWYISAETTADIKSAVGDISVDVDIDPWVYMLSAAYKF